MAVTRDAIAAARVALLRQLGEWEHRDDIVEASDEEGGRDEEEEGMDEEEEGEEQPDIQVEIARGVTQAMVDRIPAVWLLELTVELRSDGMLMLVAVETLEHNYARMWVEMNLGSYARAQDRLVNRYPYTFDHNGYRHSPDGVLLKRVDRPPAPRLPILVVEVEVKKRSIQQLIQVATEYLQQESVQSVVGFKIFRALKRAHRRSPPRVKKPAIAVVFERVPGQVAAPYTVRVAQEISFGSAPIPRHARVSLSELPTRTLEADGDNPRVIPRSPYEQVTFGPQNVEASFGLMRPLTLVVPGPDYALALDADRLPELVFDLRGVFQRALEGWEDDQYDDY